MLADPAQLDPRWPPDWHRLQVGALSAVETAALLELADSLGFVPLHEPGPIEGPRGFRAPGGRRYARAAIEDPDLAEALTRRLEHLWGGAPGRLNERLRFYAYDPGHSFPLHTDGFHEGGGERSLLTLLLFLNEDFEGGETRLAEPALLHRPRAGDALVFPHQRPHEGRPLRAGRKVILRTDVMFPLPGGG